MNFVKRIVNDVFENIKQDSFGKDCDLSDIAFVFPTRRAGLYLRKYILEKNQNNPIWSPDFFSISDFIQELSNKNFPDQLTLLFELYNTYKDISTLPIKSFDKFYPWGKIILSDFNDIDQNLIDSKIFTELQVVSDNNEDKSINFLKTYNDFILDLNKLNINFKKKLNNTNSSYYGLALRDIVTDLNSSNTDYFIRWKKIVFAGFNFLTKGEEELFIILKNNNKGIFYWDIDEYFYFNKDNEAGTFFRSSELINDSSNWIDKELKLTKKTINIIGTPGKIGQVKITSNLIEKHSKNIQKNNDTYDKTAIILADESLLFPVLNSIPKSINDINISMGSPVKNSPPYNFIFLILNIILDQQYNDNKFKILFEDAKKILLHPYILINSQFGILESMIHEFISKHTKNETLYLNKNDFKELGEYISILFDFDINNNSDILIEYIEKIIFFLKKILIENENKIELEYLFALFKKIKRFKELFLEYKPEIGLKQTRKILIDYLDNTIVPFSGEPLKGIQILGMLETRAIDFENVYILSVNEGIFPKGKTPQTLIPTEIRKFYGMSYFEKRDAIFAYYFYRIIKSASNINILYNTESDDFAKGEKSRFIEQINHEFTKINKESEISEQIITIESDFSIPKQIIINKSNQIIKELKNMSYSASSINKYLNCSLNFYFRYILKIKEPEKPDSLDAKGFGTFIHNILENIYKPFLNKEFKIDNIDFIKKNLSTVIEKHFKSNLNIKDTKKGKNYINKIIINNLLNKYFNYEIKELPLTIKGLEKSLKRKLELNNENIQIPINIYGTIDRIDKKDDILRVIDYKTGKFNSLKNIISIDSSIEEIIEFIGTKKEILQLMVYNFLINGDKEFKKFPNTIYGITFFKSLSKGKVFLNNNNSTKELNKISELVISTILTDILDKEKPFLQTEKKENCKHCIYKDICYK